MLVTRDEVKQDKNFDALTEAILDRDQPRTAGLFFDMVKKQGYSEGKALSIVTAAEAPFVQVPSHVNLRDGNVALVNNDHTILGLRTSTSLIDFVPPEYRLLPLLQSVWYIPAGLDIWNQLLAKYPGRYAMMKGFEVPPPDYGPVVWNEHQDPIVESGTLEERLHEYTIATMSGDVKRAYGLFLGLAAEEAARPALRDQLRFLGVIDVQDTVAGRKARNTGHKSIRARAVTDLADFVGWDNAHGVFYTGMPDMAVGPLYYSVYDAACVLLNDEFPEDGGKNLRRTNELPLTEKETAEMVELLMDADSETIWNLVTTHLRGGKSIKSIGDTIQIGASEAILRTTEPRKYTEAQHPFDYCNTANDWFRTSENDCQARVLYVMANFVNDAARSGKLSSTVIDKETAEFDFSSRSPQELLTALDEAILALDVPRTTALAQTYLKSGADRKAYMASVAVTASKFQDDPHNQKITHSTFEEYLNNSTHMRDQLLLATPRLLAGWVKMPGERDCYARFMKEWIHN